MNSYISDDLYFGTTEASADIVGSRKIIQTMDWKQKVYWNECGSIEVKHYFANVRGMALL